MRRLARPLLYTGIFAIVFGLAKIHAGYVAEPPYDFTGSSRFTWTVAYCALLVVGAYGAGLPDLPRSIRQAFTSSAVAPVAAAAGISLLQLLTGDALLPRFVVFGSALLVVPLSLFSIAIARGGRVRAELRDRVILVSEDAEAAALRDELQGEPERPAVLVDHLPASGARSPGRGSRPLIELAVSIRANLVVLDRLAMADPGVVAEVAALHENGIRIRTLSGFYDEWLGKLPVSELERASLFFDIRELHGARYLRVKRVADVLIGTLACIPLLVATPLVLLGNVIANRGPLLYRQERVGKNSRPITIVKFRTMRPSAPGAEAVWTQRADPRVTTFGRFLRSSHLDELPQALNIVRGDLSIVGPRPEQPKYVAELTQKLPFYDMRHLVRPGLTGWAQVKYGYAGDEDDALEKLQYEFWYLGHQSLGLDARIVGRSIRSIVGGQGRGR